MADKRVVVIGAGTAGLAATLLLVSHGFDVTVVERASRPGGKMREVAFGQIGIDSGPTVFTMRWVFDELFASIGERLEDHITLAPLDILARHAWPDGTRLDLFADQARSIDAIGGFAGRIDADGYRAFCADAKKIYDILKAPFICSPSPSMTSLLRSTGFRNLTAIKPFQTMWKALGGYFKDPRLQQLFGRYATYCGSSPFHAPATLMLVAHVESCGVWSVDGGMYRLAEVLADAAAKRGVRFRYGVDVTDIRSDFGRVSGVRLSDGETIPVDAVVAASDVAAIANGLLGNDAMKSVAAMPDSARSLSAMTWSCFAKAGGFPLLRHSVFFSRNYQAEFDRIFASRQMPLEPTVYVCAQDRSEGPSAHEGPERLFILINAPATGDRRQFDSSEVSQCAQRTLDQLRRCGLSIEATPDMTQVTTPADFNRLFPATGGALYGRSSHGWMASFQRPGVRTKLPGLYLAGGSIHPGPGVPMAALSGRMAAASVIADSRRRSELTAALPRRRTGT